MGPCIALSLSLSLLTRHRLSRCNRACGRSCGRGERRLGPMRELQGDRLVMQGLRSGDASLQAGRSASCASQHIVGSVFGGPCWRNKFMRLPHRKLKQVVIDSRRVRFTCARIELPLQVMALVSQGFGRPSFQKPPTPLSPPLVSFSPETITPGAVASAGRIASIATVCFPGYMPPSIFGPRATASGLSRPSPPGR